MRFLRVNSYQMTDTLISLRLDDLPLLQHIISDLGVAQAIDSALPPHGHWSGISIGQVAATWLCYILSECDHRLQNVEEWSVQNLDLLRILNENAAMSRLDFTDDKLGALLDKISDVGIWGEIESAINGRCLSIYRLNEADALATFRVDAAPMQSHGEVKADGLLQYGYHKHHADLPQFKVKLCSLDNDLTHFSYPVASMTVSGNQSDDGLYIPIIEQSKAVLRNTQGYERGNLYIGDSKFGAIENRAYVVAQEDYYLMPLSLVQLSQKARKAIIESTDKSLYSDVRRMEGKEKVTIATGFESTDTMNYVLDGQVLSWTERRLFVQSAAYATSQIAAFEVRLSKVKAALTDLCVRKKGKAVIETAELLQKEIDKLLKDNHLGDFLTVQIITTTTTTTLRAYGTKSARTVLSHVFELDIATNDAAMDSHKALLGWQVYATNTPLALLPFADCVFKYRHQSNIEHNFNHLRNKVAHLVPVFLQKESRIIGLVHILSLALKVCAVLEYKIADALHKTNAELSNIYEGNPKRSTPRPSAKRICKAFKGISLAIICTDNVIKYAIMTVLDPKQVYILQLLGIPQTVYTKIAQNVKFFFSPPFFNET